jgi:hypothetical protein
MGNGILRIGEKRRSPTTQQSGYRKECSSIHAKSSLNWDSAGLPRDT